jgi:hypothetical protein
LFGKIDEHCKIGHDLNDGKGEGWVGLVYGKRCKVVVGDGCCSGSIVDMLGNGGSGSIVVMLGNGGSGSIVDMLGNGGSGALASNKYGNGGNGGGIDVVVDDGDIDDADENSAALSPNKSGNAGDIVVLDGKNSLSLFFEL